MWYTKNMKRLWILLCLLLLLMGCGGKEESSAGADGTKPLEITWWIPVGDDMSYSTPSISSALWSSGSA